MGRFRIPITGTTISAASDRSWIHGQRNGYKEKARLGARERIASTIRGWYTLDLRKLCAVNPRVDYSLIFEFSKTHSR
jgi:hypothetical protein